MKKFLSRTLLAMLAVTSVSCAAYYEDEVLPPTEQEMKDSLIIRPQQALQEGIFHMQRVQDGSSVRVKDKIQYKRPGLPPFDVAYISRDLESVLLELSNAAGESVILPQGLRGRTITLVHSGADFQQMLDLVLEKSGYHYNYVNGVWRITRYPVRNYVLELSQSTRKGSLVASEELGIESDGTSSTSGGEKLDSSYADEIWEQVEETLKELVEVGKTELKGGGSSTSSGGITATGQVLNEGESLLPPPTVEGADAGEIEDFFGTITDNGGFKPFEVSTPKSNDHLVPEEKANPWFKVTRSAGLLTVRAAPEAHRMVEEYLEQVQQTSHRQIFLEVRVVAVTKKKETDRGTNINFNDAVGSTSLINLGFKAASPLSAATTSGAFAHLSSPNNDIDAVVQSLSDIGDVYAISSPSLLARNNQLSRVSITRQLGYVETKVEQSTTSTGDVVIGSRTDTPRFKNSGTVMSVFPYIGRNRVQLRMRLAVAQKSGDTAIQTTVGNNATITNNVPELTNNIIDQDMVLEYGRVYALGGLIETSTGYDHTYIPGLNQLPGMREIFQRAEATKTDTEFMVLLRVSRS